MTPQRSVKRIDLIAENDVSTMTDDPLTQFGLDAIDLRWTLKDITAKRWVLTPIKPDHLARLIDLGLVEMRGDIPFVTVKGQDMVG
jgi:hypothetical protein